MLPIRITKCHKIEYIEIDVIQFSFLNFESSFIMLRFSGKNFENLITKHSSSKLKEIQIDKNVGNRI